MKCPLFQFVLTPTVIYRSSITLGFMSGSWFAMDSAHCGERPCSRIHASGRPLDWGLASAEGLLEGIDDDVELAAQILIFFVSLNFLRVELGDVSMFKFWIFTQVIIVCAPGLFWRERGTRVGSCWQLVVTLVLVCVMSFNPWGNMWSLISPYFAIENNPWYYVMGAGVLLFAVYDVLVYAKLPKKPATLPNGKRPLF